MSSMTAPSLSLISRSQRDAICGSWVAMMTVISLSRRSLVSKSRIPVAVCESRLPVGAAYGQHRRPDRGHRLGPGSQSGWHRAGHKRQRHRDRDGQAEARATAAGSPVVALLVKAAELHVRADLGVVDAAEHDLTPAALAALRLPAAPAADPGTQSSSA